MYRRLRLLLGRWLLYGMPKKISNVTATRHPRRFNLLRWFSILSFFVMSIISVGFASTLSHFLTGEILQRDALLTSQFVHSIVSVENRQQRLGHVTLGSILDRRADLEQLGVDRLSAMLARNEFYEHISLLPDVLLANVFGTDRRVIWSTNSKLVGHVDDDNDELKEAFAKHTMVATNYLDQEHHNEAPHKMEQAFAFDPKKFFIESYIPLLDAGGKVVSVVEIYKEPESLLDAVQRCQQLVWASTAVGMVFLYLMMFWMIRRADATLEDQQRRLLESETLCVVGEMSASVAHGIRNPLASIRSSAELALDGDAESLRKNAKDIISQVDRLSKWVRELLVFSRPTTGETEAIDLVTLIEECLPNFSPQLQRNGVDCLFTRPGGVVPRVKGNRSLCTQALASVISNAIEAMPEGGYLQVELQAAEKDSSVCIVVSDSGTGIPENQMDLIFKPFYTTKRNGLGLGMALAKRIMERFDGDIRLSSGAVNGTRVSLTFTTK